MENFGFKHNKHTCKVLTPQAVPVFQFLHRSKDQTWHWYEFDLKGAGTLLGGFTADQGRANKCSSQTERWHRAVGYSRMCRAPALHVFHVAGPKVSCDTLRSEDLEIGTCEHHLPGFDVKKWSGLRNVLRVKKNDRKSNSCPQLQPQMGIWARTQFRYWFSLIFAQSHELSRGYVTVLCPIRVHIGLRGEWRFGIEAKRLIALATSIRIHLETGLETKWWFLNFENDLDIWVSK